MLEPLLKAGTDPRIRTRAWLVQARLDEAGDDAVSAADAYRQAIALAEDEPELAEDARQALVRLVGSAGDERRALLLAELDPQARALVSIQIKLGEARALLESGQAEQAQAAFAALLEQGDLDPISKRDVRTGLGESLARQGQTTQALVVWRDLLSETAQAQDRIFLQLRIADGLLSGGRYDDAAAAFDEIAEDPDPDISAQGKLGLAQVSLARGERERARADLRLVADQAKDPAWRVRALEELATIATEDGDSEASLSAWRSVLTAAKPGDAAIGRARLAVIQILAASGRTDAAQAACRDAVQGAIDRRARLRAMLSCGELDQRQGGDPTRALDRYEAVLAQATDPARSSPSDIIVDAATAAAGLALSLNQPDRALAAAISGLDQARQAADRLALLDLQARALDALGQDSSAARQARDSLVSAAPQAALGMLVERAHRAQGQDERDAAIKLLSQGVAAVSDPSLAVGARLELADVQLDAGQIDAADASYAQVASSSSA
ncbi:MAG: tetratricopeptide repeat protein, partial [Oligoflexia bacterium]|nr:tetratricopeptide repeat protein [Oligoflexia bacterium]